MGLRMHSVNAPLHEMPGEPLITDLTVDLAVRAVTLPDSETLEGLMRINGVSFIP